MACTKKHECACNGAEHNVGDRRCRRHMVDPLIRMPNRMWRFKDSILSETRVLDLGFEQHECGCWSRVIHRKNLSI